MPAAEWMVQLPKEALHPLSLLPLLLLQAAKLAEEIIRNNPEAYN